MNYRNSQPRDSMVRMNRYALVFVALTTWSASLDALQAQSGDISPPTAVVAYGPDSLQFGELRLPPGSGPFPVVVGIHGGCWLDRLGEGSLTPAIVALTEEGIATWNVEYRRLGHSGGGWPGTFLDVGAGVDHLRALADDFPLDLERVVLIGHSSGGHLAIWAAARPWLPEESPIRGSSPLTVTGAVGIDGPVDLARWSRGGTDVQVCGEPVIAALLGGGPEDRPERYRDASPIEMPRLGVPVYLNPAAMILGLSDPDILKRRAEETGEIVTVVPVTNSDHFQLITPGHEAWSPVLRTIKTALGLR